MTTRLLLRTAAADVAGLCLLLLELPGDGATCTL